MIETPQLVNIVIPLYTTKLGPNELVSLRRCFDLMLGKYPITIIKPESLDLSPLAEIIRGAAVESFADKYFQGIYGYNMLMMSPDIYERFLNYKYILIYQTDCYLFRDELEEWCSKGYDYAGAPWVSKAKYDKRYYRIYMKMRNSLIHLMGRRSPYDIIGKIGNGGFSLRRTRAFYDIASAEQATVKRFMRLCRRSAQYNEDVFWGAETFNLGYNFKTPDYHEALKFSFDVRPEIAYADNGNQLPMGCHGWTKRDMIGFWSRFIPAK